MGIYVYTRRRHVRCVSGVHIGQFLFAHKAWTIGDPPTNVKRAEANQYNCAHRAYWARPDVEHFILRDWKLTDGDAHIAVRRISSEKIKAVFYDSILFEFPVVGHVRKIGPGKFDWAYEPVTQTSIDMTRIIEEVAA